MNDVLRLQRVLNKTGFGPIGEDGKRGPQTSASLGLYQKARTTYPKGIDVSKWQPKVDWVKVKAAGASFAICKGTHGLGRDALFTSHWAAIKAAGLIRGMYHWFSPQQPLIGQADNIYKAVGVLGAGDLPVSLDIERDGLGADNLANTADDIKATDAQAEQLANLVEERTGKRPLVYSYGPYLDQRNIEVGSCSLWLADYRSGPGTVPPGWDSYVFHQYAGDDGEHPGVTGPCDLNYFRGTIEGLRTLAG